MNHPLARALRGAGVDTQDVAARLDVDPKTVGRWLAGRMPYPRHRTALARITGWAVDDLWPSVARPVKPDMAADEVRTVYSHRSTVPADAWARLFLRAEREISVLAYSALFLAEDSAAQRVLCEKARTGVRVRVALGDPAGRHVARRGGEEGIDSVMTARIRNALLLHRPLASEPGVWIRLHDTVLYNSIYRADDEFLVNAHVYGVPASHSPVLHLCRSNSGGMAETYLDSFERVWATARDLQERDYLSVPAHR
jgi:hypothetical protein